MVSLLTTEQKLLALFFTRLVYFTKTFLFQLKYVVPKKVTVFKSMVTNVIISVTVLCVIREKKMF